MAERTFVYVDGESHFIRSQACWRSLHGDGASLERLRYVGHAVDPLVLALPKAKVFWTRKLSPGVERAIYFTSASGSHDELHQIKLMLRRFDLEPAVVHEHRDLADHRKNLLQSDRIIEKPKGVDIALAVRAIEDASHQAYDVCHLYTSDADFLPLIHALRARGKRVHVFGYTNGLSQQSDLLHVPDLFVDLTHVLDTECEPGCFE